MLVLFFFFFLGVVSPDIDVDWGRPWGRSWGPNLMYSAQGPPCTWFLLPVAVLHKMAARASRRFTVQYRRVL